MAGPATYLGLLLALALPAAALYRRSTDRGVTWPALRSGLLVQWAVTLALFGLVAATEADVLAAFGGPGGDPVMDAMVAFILVGAFGIGTSLGAHVLSGAPVDDVVRTLLGLSPARKVLVAVTAGVTEEVVLRGYLLTQLQALGASTVLAALVAIALGVVAHAARRSVARLVFVVPVQVAFVLAFLVTGNVLACVLAHVAYDLLVLLTTSPSDLRS